MSNNNGPPPDGEIVFVIRYDPATRGVSWRCTPGFPHDALVNGLGLAQLMFQSLQLQAVTQGQPPPRLTFPDGTPFTPG